METITSISQHPISEGDLETWSEALIDRFKREPTSLDLLNDPLVALARTNKYMHPEVLRNRLAAKSKEAFERRKSADGKKARP